VKRLIDGDRPAGSHRAEWEGDDDAGQRVPPGVYLCRLRMGADRSHGRLLRIE
jgi:flagellar hook assembly protein FlgD